MSCYSGASLTVGFKDLTRILFLIRWRTCYDTVTWGKLSNVFNRQATARLTKLPDLSFGAQVTCIVCQPLDLTVQFETLAEVHQGQRYLDR